MRKILLLLAALTALAAVPARGAVGDSAAGESSGLFNEDRVWTYSSAHFMDFLNGPYTIEMRFDGTTEYQGQLYHNYTNTLYFDRSNQKTLTPCRPILVRED